MEPPSKPDESKPAKAKAKAAAAKKQMKKCALPRSCTGLIGGLSCKDFSTFRTTGEKDADGRSLWEKVESPGQSAQCLHGFVDLLHAVPTSWFVLENSDELEAADKFQEALYSASPRKPLKGWSGCFERQELLGSNFRIFLALLGCSSHFKVHHRINSSRPLGMVQPCT